MRVLLVEDHTLLAESIAEKLRDQHGHQVVWARDPLAAANLLRREEFDIAVIDLLYQHLIDQFDDRRKARKVSLTDPSTMLITGLFAVQAFRKRRASGGVVLWTSGEGNRRLHIPYAYEDLDVRAFCSKSPGTGKPDLLHETILAADAGLTKVDPVLNPYLPAPGHPKVSHTLLRNECHRRIWRSLSLGYHTRKEIARVTGYSQHTIKNNVPEMLDDLALLDIWLRPGLRPANELISYASQNWEFFLDESVRESYR